MAVQLDVRHALLLRPGEGETITDRAGRTVRLLLAHDLLDVTWSRYEPGERGPDPHVHREHVDSFFVLESELVFEVGPQVEQIRAPAGTFVAVPQNVVHTFANESEVTALFLNFHSPSGGFAEHLRGHGEGFDSFDPPEDGGRPASMAIVTPPGEGERSVRKDRVNTIKGELPELSAFQLAVEPVWLGIGTHAHSDHVDMFFVLGGEVGLVVGDDVVRAGAGSFYAAPVGAPHGIRNEPAGRSVLLNVHAPDAGFAESIRSR
jgi:mannose-6-phosphate isomerase-like protein (cupin superfamily)